MTCLLNTYGKISNLKQILQILDDEAADFPPAYSSQNEKTSSENRKENWFDQFQFALSPNGNLACIASQNIILICQGKWDLNNEIKYALTSKIVLTEPEYKDECITSILCLPIASQKISGEGLLEWTCIVVGFSSGNIRMYTENGTLLITQMFHDDKVLKLKCRTYETPKYLGWISQPEEVEILYAKNIIICLDGANLFHYLRAARKYAANLTGERNEMIEMLSSMQLDYKKWRFDSQEVLSDFVSGGLTNDSLFDQLFAASMIGGPNERFESIPPTYTRYLTCGQTPFVSTYCALDGQSQPVLQEVKAVAGKITSSLMNAAKGWIGFGKASSSSSSSSNAQQSVAPKPKIEAATFLYERMNIKDYRRLGESIIISPGNRLVATTDTFARVILIDALKGICVRVFKGYRDAQIGWICVDDDSSRSFSHDDKSKKSALYLIIYAKRRGLLEIWGCQQGIRVAAFNVGKDCTLVYPGYFMLSLNGGLLNANSHHMNKNTHQCFLINSDGILKTIHIPFHLILSDKSNERVRDTILLKKFKTILRENKNDDDSLWHNLKILLNDFKIASIKQQALEKLLNTSYLSPNKIEVVFVHELEQIKKQENNLTSDLFKLGEFLKFNLNLIKSYIFIQSLFNNYGENATRKETYDKEYVQKLSDLMSIEESNLKDYFGLKKALDEKQSNAKRVKFALDEEHEISYKANGENKFKIDLSKFLSCFESYSSALYLEKNLNQEDKQILGAFLFSVLLSSNYAIKSENVNDFFEHVPLKKSDMLDLLMNSCLSNHSAFESVFNMYNLLDTLCLNNEDEKSQILSSYFHVFKNLCENSSNLMNALLLSWIYRSILSKIDSEANLIDTLNILIDRLYCLMKLNILFSNGKKAAQEANSSSETELVPSLRSILRKGKGALTELTSKYVIANEIKPKLLGLIDADEFKNEKDNEQIKALSSRASDFKILDLTIDDMSVLLQNDENRAFYSNLQEARKYLPKSLEPDTILLNCVWECAKQYDKDLNTKHLENSLRYCGEIGNAILKQGILSLLWHNYLNKRIRLLTELVDKAGRLPKDKSIVRKEANINEESVLKFLECIMTCLDLVMDANCSMNEVPIFNYDQFWKDHNIEYTDFIATNLILNLSNTQMSLNENSIAKSENSSTNQMSSTSSTNTNKNTNSNTKQLAELASEQKPVNYHLCLFQYQLIRILYLIIKYNMKSVRPLSFYDSKGQQALFSDLNTHPLISNDVDVKILNARKLFLTKAMNAIMAYVDLPSNIKAKLSNEIKDILQVVFNLSNELGIDFEYIQRYFCCMLYALDYHAEAEKVLHSIKESELIAAQLLVVVGYKLNEIFDSMHLSANLLSILSTNLNSWLKSIGPSDYKTYTINTSKKPLLELMGIILNKLPDTYSEYKIAVELYDFLDNPEFQFK